MGVLYWYKNGQSINCGVIPQSVTIGNVLYREQTVQGPASIANSVSFTQFRLQSDDKARCMDDKASVHKWDRNLYITLSVFFFYIWLETISSKYGYCKFRNNYDKIHYKKMCEPNGILFMSMF